MDKDPFKEYLKESEPDKVDKGYTWSTAIGLQAVDGLKPSKYLIDTAIQNIEGKITIKEAKNLIDTYYEEKPAHLSDDERTEEADKVSSRIAEILSETAFSFSPNEYISIHRKLFHGIYIHAVKIRDYNITKKEWVLKGDTVIYASWNSIKDTLDYDFRTEKEFSYEGLSLNESIKHLVKFASDIWQIHPFAEGNTRATAVFIIKYMKTFGLKVDNDAFKKHSWYFRNALVRANYNDLKNGIHATTKYLEMFFSNLLMGTDYELRNRYMHVDCVLEQFDNTVQSAMKEVLKGKICTLNCPLDELAILRLIVENPNITQKEIANKIGKSERTVKNRVASLKEKGYIQRLNGKRNGKWEILIDLD